MSHKLVIPSEARDLLLLSRPAGSNKNTTALRPVKFLAQSTHSAGTGKTNSPPPANTPPQTASSSTDALAPGMQPPPPPLSPALARQTTPARSIQKTIHPSTPHTPESRRNVPPAAPLRWTSSPAESPPPVPASAHSPAPRPQETPDPQPSQKRPAGRSAPTGSEIPASKSRCPLPETPRLCFPALAASRRTPESTFPPSLQAQAPPRRRTSHRRTAR